MWIGRHVDVGNTHSFITTGISVNISNRLKKLYYSIEMLGLTTKDAHIYYSVL